MNADLVWEKNPNELAPSVSFFFLSEIRKENNSKIITYDPHDPTRGWWRGGILWVARPARDRVDRFDEGSDRTRSVKDARLFEDRGMGDAVWETLYVTNRPAFPTNSPTGGRCRQGPGLYVL